MSTSRLDQLASAATDELLDAVITETDTSVRRAALDRVRRNRRGARLTGLAAAMIAVLIVVHMQGNFPWDSDPQPMEPAPGKDVGDVPVWYDDAGLHRGDIVEQPPVELRQMDGDAIEDGVLSLVRTGALYLDPATDDVWFHPWGGEPRIVGHGSGTGPSSDADGDVAVWMEGWEVVVYDTSENREIARTMLTWRQEKPYDSNTCHGGCAEHDQPGNGFLEVSDEHIVWTASQGFDPSYSLDVRTGVVTKGSVASVDNIKGTVDVHEQLSVYAAGGESNLWGWHLVLDIPGQAPKSYPMVNPRSRFSSSGDYVLSYGNWVGGAADRVTAATIDTKTGTVWPIPDTGWSWVAWSYGDIALLNPSRGSSEGNVHQLLACHPVKRTCAQLPVTGAVLMPTS